MKKATIALLVLGILVMSFSVVMAKGGKRGMHVCWEQSDGEQNAYFKITGSGIIQQWRYDPSDLHLVFKPKDKFPNPPDEGSWSSWTWKGSEGEYGQYDPCNPSSDLTLENVFGNQNRDFWVEITYQD